MTIGTGEAERIVFLAAMPDHLRPRIARALGEGTLWISTLAALRAARGRVLLSFGTSVIVPEEELARFPGGACNLHAASPSYPGRDPHHWAVYDGATRYGATLHVMTARVDEGPILDVEWFDVAPATAPAALLAEANEAAARIIERAAPLLRRGELPPPRPGLAWSGRKRSRRDFHRMCRITPDMPQEEFARRYFAFDGGAHDNLTICLHGRLFRIDKSGGC